MSKLETSETTEIHKKGRRKESENHINRKVATTVIIGDSMVNNLQCWKIRKPLSKVLVIFNPGFQGGPGRKFHIPHLEYWKCLHTRNDEVWFEIPYAVIKCSEQMYA